MPVNIPEYDKIYDFIRRKGLTFDEVLQSWELERITISSYKEFKSVKEKLKELENIQGNCTTILITNKKIKRNRNLVKKLKMLYEFRC